MFEVKTKGQSDWKYFDPTNDSDIGRIKGLCLFLLQSTSSQVFIVGHWTCGDTPSLATVADYISRY